MASPRNAERISVWCACGGGMQVYAAPPIVAEQALQLFWQIHNGPKCSHHTGTEVATQLAKPADNDKPMDYDDP